MADQVEEVKRKTDIVSLVGERVKLARAGRNFKALCPFHSERTPSFMVSPELQIYKCFGCGKAGDVYAFLEEFEGREFPEALSYLAKRAGVRLEPFRKGKDFQKKERLWSINHLASEYFHFLLSTHKVGERARRYLAERGIRKRAIEAFQIGYAPDSWDALSGYLVGKKRYKMEELAELGLVVRSKSRMYDRFRDRVIFPLRDVAGNVLGFSGRVLPGKEQAGGKYINSPETTLYHKSEHLYGLHENRSWIKKKDEAIVVEGELDAISSWQARVRRVVAIKGTALTEEQIALLRRYTRNIVLALDADSAGDAATKRGIALADSASLNIKVVLLSGAKDPDAISKDDPNKWRRLVTRASSVYDFYLSSARSRFDLATGLGKKRAAEELVGVLSGISNVVERAHYIKKAARLLDVSDANVVDEITRFQKMTALQAAGSGRKTSEDPEGVKTPDRRAMLEEYFLSLVLQGGEDVLDSLENFSTERLSHPVIRRVVALFSKRGGAGGDVGGFVASLPAELRDTAQAAFLRDLDGMSPEEDRFQREVGRVVDELRRIWLKEELTTLSGDIRQLEEKRRPTASDKKKLMTLKRTFSELSHQLSD